jgi:hypothetical protein
MRELVGGHVDLVVLCAAARVVDLDALERERARVVVCPERMPCRMQSWTTPSRIVMSSAWWYTQRREPAEMSRLSRT